MDPATWPQSPDYFEVAKGTESTNGRLWDMRPVIFFNMMQRGYTPVMHAETWGEHHGVTNVLVVLDHEADAVALRGLLAALEAEYWHAVRPLLVLSNGPGGGRSPAAVQTRLGQQFQTDEAYCCYVGRWDMHLKKLDGQLYREADVFTEALLTMRGIIETTRPALILVPHRRGSPVSRAVAEAAGQMHVPTAALLLPDWEEPRGAPAPGGGEGQEHNQAGAPNVNWGAGHTELPAESVGDARAAAAAEGAAVLREANEGVFSGALGDAVPAAMAPWALGAAPAAASLGFAEEEARLSRMLDPPSPLDAPATGAGFDYATSSPGLLLRHVEALLCACEKPDSNDVGAYAQCPWRTPEPPSHPDTVVAR